MLDDLPPDALLVADAGFIGDDLCRRIEARSLAFLFRVGGNVRLLTELGVKCEVRGETVYLWTDKAQRGGRPPLFLRLIALGPPDKRVYLVTNVLDAQRLSVRKPLSTIGSAGASESSIVRSTRRCSARRSTAAPDNCRQELAWGVVGLWMMGLMKLPERLAVRQESRRWSHPLLSGGNRHYGTGGC